jgi:hypothetical protein
MYKINHSVDIILFTLTIRGHGALARHWAFAVGSSNGRQGRLCSLHLDEHVPSKVILTFGLDLFEAVDEVLDVVRGPVEHQAGHQALGDRKNVLILKS